MIQSSVVFVESMEQKLDKLSGASAQHSERSEITTDERSRREKAYRAARASVILEGFTPSSEEEDRARRFINGEMDLPDYVRTGASLNDPFAKAESITRLQKIGTSD